MTTDYTVQKEAEKIFRDVLLRDDRLALPDLVKEVASRTTFDQAAISKPYIPCPLKFTESSSALWALISTFGNAIVKKRYGIDQSVVVNTDIASLFLMSSALVKVDGKGLQDPEISKRTMKFDLAKMLTEPWRRLSTNIYPTKDGRWYHTHGSMNADRVLTCLGLPLHDPENNEGEIIKRYCERVSQFDSDWLDIVENEHFQQAGTICLTPDEYLASPQGKAVANDPLFLLEQSSQDILPPVPWPETKSATFRPLEGIKIIDISRVIAAPTICKLAALFGATVVRISCDFQPDMGSLLVDGNLGKRDVTLNLKSPEGRKALEKLLEDADVILDGYRPGALQRLGFGPAYVHALARKRGKGIVYIRENCYGWSGPFAHRSGWQQISDCITGVSWLMGEFLGLKEPVVPLLPNSDYQTGIIGLLGILSALDKRAESGGNFLVSVSLNQFNSFLLSLGSYSPEIQESLRSQHSNLHLRHYDDMIQLVSKTLRSLFGAVPHLFQPKYFSSMPSNMGAGKDETLTFVGPVATFDTTKLCYDVGSCFLGTYQPVWP
ncbi:CAIB/BAIF family enzyme [Lepidopterella palustris CBS 459.81]|uniref:CAIB/BAIF family enzyme n=1 Tax=Lepidopterella palustris CBS 459.81 TaxID=1314670 RepID=A0A8E2ELX2_9PEZI|nr:CAIB/BAIF family enzyme [Lepidopterella palustris CBS 459.81]